MYKLETHLDCDCIFTMFLNFHPNRFCFILEPRELVWESVWSILHRNSVSRFKLFFKLFQMWNLVFRFFRFQTQENRFWGLGTFFARFFVVEKIINLFTVLQILYKSWKMFYKRFSYEPSRQYGISPFSKTCYMWLLADV